MRRRKLPPDTRLDWRDPNMPVLREMEFAFGVRRLVEVPPEEEQEYFAEKMRDRRPNPTAPLWYDDDTYNLARPGAKRRRM